MEEGDAVMIGDLCTTWDGEKRTTVQQQVFESWRRCAADFEMIWLCFFLAQGCHLSALLSVPTLEDGSAPM